MMGNLDFLKRKVEPESKQEKWIDSALKAAERGAALTRQLLNFSRDKQAEEQVVDLNQQLQELEMVIGRAMTPSIEVYFDLADALGGVRLDPGELQDAVMNLVINAKQAMPEGGRLVISTAHRRVDSPYIGGSALIPAGEYVVLTVADSGLGMEPQVRERIFEPFFTTKPEGEGTGLGLAMVYGFARRCRGFVNVYSEVGEGTTFRLYLPVDETHAVESTPVVELYESEARGNGRVLVVEDEPDIREIAALQLESLGYEVASAGDGREALAHLERETVDVVFSDIVMPGGMSGVDLAKQVLRRWPRTRVVLTTGFAQKYRDDALLERLPVLAKPYRKQELAAIMRSTFEAPAVGV